MKPVQNYKNSLKNTFNYSKYTTFLSRNIKFRIITNQKINYKAKRNINIEIYLNMK